MSGRAYARTAQGFLGGGAHLESIVPHTFRLAPPKRTHSARELAIRRVIRRRCMEKNWKKLIARRHARSEGDQETEQQQAPAVAAADAPVAQSESTAVTAAATAPRRPKQEKKPDSETVGVARRQLEELEAKLQTLVDEKHAKFLQLKTILVQEARSKSAGTPTAAAPAKKRRVELKGDAATASPRSSSAPSDPSAAGSPQPHAAAATAAAAASTSE